MITGIYTPSPVEQRKWDDDRERDRIRLQHDADVRAYFESLGYRYSWDSNWTHGSWHEISDEDGLVAQIDMGIPLLDIIEDFTANAAGKPGTSKSNYAINGGGKRYDAMLARVAANQRGGIQEKLAL